MIVLGDLPGDLIHPAGQLLLTEEDLLNVFFQHNGSSFPHLLLNRLPPEGSGTARL